MNAWTWLGIVIGLVLAGLIGVTIYDLTQKRHAILRNYPIIGHLRFILERFGPELRQYIVTNNDEERPFNRDQRRWVYASAKKENSYFGFGSDSNFDADGYSFFRHTPFPPHVDTDAPLPAAKVIGAWRGRPGAFRPASVTNISAMSFGSLSGPAIEALNRGSAIAGCLHNTGEGGISSHHRRGGDLIFQIGTGYFGARNDAGEFSIDALLASMADAPVKAIEIKLSQGAKPGLGGVLPGEKVTLEISRARGVPVGTTVVSPSAQSAFHDVASMVDVIEAIASATGVPVGIKSAVGQVEFWSELAAHMAHTGTGPDFITVDGGEGGTGAAPLVFADHVSVPFKRGFPTVMSAFVREGLHLDVVFFGAGKLGFAADAAIAMAMGVDVVNVGREAMLAIGCIQAQKCHTGHCPTGVATQQARLARGLDPTDKSVRLANYVLALNRELMKLAAATGVTHPALIDPRHIEIRGSDGDLHSVLDHYGLDTAAFGAERRQRLQATLLANHP